MERKRERERERERENSVSLFLIFSYSNKLSKSKRANIGEPRHVALNNMWISGSMRERKRRLTDTNPVSKHCGDARTSSLPAPTCSNHFHFDSKSNGFRPNSPGAANTRQRTCSRTIVRTMVREAMSPPFRGGVYSLNVQTGISDKIVCFYIVT
jgi:hypothetical protein